MRRLFWIGLALAVSAEALARVGGGESFSTGGGGGGSYSGGGGSYSGGGGGDGGDIGFLIYLWIRLCIQYPAVGIPLTLVGIAFFGARAMYSGRGRSHKVYGGVAGRDEERRRRRAQRSEDLVQDNHRAASTAAIGSLRERDPGFSLPVLQEYLALVHRRALEAACTGAWEPLAPFVSDEAREAVKRDLAGVKEVREVVHAGLRVDRVEVGRDWIDLGVTFLGSRREIQEKGERRVYVEEKWTFRRAASAASLPPDEMLRMGCPSCGAAVETDRMGQCGQCGTAITRGQLQWQAVGAREVLRRPIEPPKVSMAAGGDEPNLRPGSRVAPDLGTNWRQFTARHPDFSLPAFKDHVQGVFLELQSAWSDAKWERARPYCTEPLFQTLRFYMEQYGEAGLKNRLGDITFDQVEVVKVDQDAWYEAITVRVWASMKDWVEDEKGTVVGGNKKVARRFSEYWTFLRATGTGAGSKSVHECPSCGAKLDRVSAAGICGYCDTKITSGRFDWVLSRIDQVETYPG